MQFNPEEKLIKIGVDADGKEKKYLEVKYRKAWFRNEHPNGMIKTSVNMFNGIMAIAEASIFFDKDDANPVATDFGSAIYNPNDIIGVRCVENAVTAAIGRALASAGYNVLDGYEEDNICDAPSSTTKTVELSLEKEIKKEEEKTKRKRKKAEAVAEPTVAEPVPVAEPTPMAESTVAEPIAEPTPVVAPVPVAEPAPVVAPVPIAPVPVAAPAPVVAPTPMAEPTPVVAPTPMAESAPVVAPTPIAAPAPQMPIAPAPQMPMPEPVVAPQMSMPMQEATLPNPFDMFKDDGFVPVTEADGCPFFDQPAPVNADVESALDTFIPFGDFQGYPLRSVVQNNRWDIIENLAATSTDPAFAEKCRLCLTLK